MLTLTFEVLNADKSAILNSCLTQRKQLRSLETRELQLLRKVSGKDDAGLFTFVGPEFLAVDIKSHVQSRTDLCLKYNMFIWLH